MTMIAFKLLVSANFIIVPLGLHGRLTDCMFAAFLGLCWLPQKSGARKKEVISQKKRCVCSPQGPVQSKHVLFLILACSAHMKSFHNTCRFTQVRLDVVLIGNLQLIYQNLVLYTPVISFNLVLGSFTNYVDKILAFFDHLPPCVDIFYGMNIDKKSIF